MLRDPAGRQLGSIDDHDAHSTGGVLVVHALKKYRLPARGRVSCVRDRLQKCQQQRLLRLKLQMKYATAHLRKRQGSICT